MGSAIYFMLTGQGYSHLHRLCTDEVYHFYSGDRWSFWSCCPTAPAG